MGLLRSRFEIKDVQNALTVLSRRCFFYQANLLSCNRLSILVYAHHTPPYILCLNCTAIVIEYLCCFADDISGSYSTCKKENEILTTTQPIFQINHIFPSQKGHLRLQFFILNIQHIVLYICFLFKLDQEFLEYILKLSFLVNSHEYINLTFQAWPFFPFLTL